MDKRYIRWASAVLVSAVCTAIGMSGAFYAYAETASCTLKDVSDWKQRLVDPTEEATPLYRLNVTEDFLEMCPDRPEIVEAHRLAGRAALDGEFVDAAIEHLQRGRSSHQHLQPREWFGLIAALIETGEEARAWAERDALVSYWLEKIEKDGLADIKSRAVKGGTIHAVLFTALEPGDYVRGVWLAVPDGKGWPSAIVLGSNAFRSSMSRLRTGSSARLETIDLVGCRERITLTQAEGEIVLETAHSAAIFALKTYLEEPELPAENGAEDLSTQCLWPKQMMPRPDPYTAVLIH